MPMLMLLMMIMLLMMTIVYRCDLMAVLLSRAFAGRTPAREATFSSFVSAYGYVRRTITDPPHHIQY